MPNQDGPIWEYDMRDFNDLRDLIENNIPEIDNYVFRGQADSRWALTSTLNRLIKHARLTGSKSGSVDAFVEKHLERFKMEIRGRRGDNPTKLEEDDLWALGQHFHLATPLLDWSRSPYISLFFALEEILDDYRGVTRDHKRALWCLNRNKVAKVNEGLADTKQMKLIFPDTDDNKRLLGQSGLFSKGPVMTSVEDWVRKNCIDEERSLIKIEFPGLRDFRKNALRKLHLMNINHSTIFPDLIGASKYCNIVAEDYEI